MFTQPVTELPPPQELHIPNSDLTRLLFRLEAATSRLEDLASPASGVDATQSSNSTTSGSTHSPAGPISPDLPGAKAGFTSSRHGPPPTQALPPSVEDFDLLIKEHVQKYTELGNKLDEVIAEQVGSRHAPFP